MIILINLVKHNVILLYIKIQMYKHTSVFLCKLLEFKQ